MKLKIGFWIILVILGIAAVLVSINFVHEHFIAPTIESDLPIDTTLFHKADSIGLIRNKKLREISGITASRKYPNHFWVHNDSGDSAKIYLINATGQLRYEYLVPSAVHTDWEDIASVTIDSTPYLVIGDFGDNMGRRKHYTLYIIEEPDIYNSSPTPVRHVISYNYANGPRDAEALLVDPISLDIYLFSKREKQIYLYNIPFPYPEDTKIQLTPITQLAHTQIVAADISPDGLSILLKDYNNIYYYPRLHNETIPEALQKKGIRVPYKRQPQGEALCWDTDGKSIYSTSEFSTQRVVPVLYQWKMKTADAN